MFLAFPLSSQVDSSIYKAKLKYVKKAAAKSLENGDYYSSLEYAKKYLQKRPNNISVLYTLAEAYRNSRDYSNAEITYQRVVEKNNSNYVKAFYYLAQMQIYNGKYEVAKTNLEIFKKGYDGKDKSDYRRYYKYLLATCEAAPTILEDTLELLITHVDTSINKAHVELSPLPLNTNEFIYSSLRSDTIVYKNTRDTVKKMQVRKFYLAEKKDSNWVFKGEYNAPFNSEDSENGNGCFNLDSSKFYFTRCEKNWKDVIICSLYMSIKIDGEWSAPIILPETVNDPDYHTTQPTVGWNSDKEMEVLYFVSNREGGRGGRDIWYSEFDADKDEFRKAKNAGSKINTSMDEMTPYYDMDSRSMYFSSEGWPGLGGFDVFESTGELRNWSEPTNLGYPLNTSVDELYYVLFPNKQEGFIVSNRKGGVALKNETCCDDIYHFKEQHFIYLAISGTVYEALTPENSSMEKDTLVPVKNVEVGLYLESDSLEPILIKKFVTGKDGKYLLPLQKDKEYTIRLTDTSHYASQKLISTIGITESDTIIKNFNLTPFSDKPIVIKNIYYPYDKAYLTDKSLITIDTTLLEILNNNPDLIIEIGSHTDSKGSDKYNEELSQRRAQSVVDYLLEKGIDRERLKAKGYGETVPIEPNTNEDGTDNVEGRAKNRRTEFKVIGKIKGVKEIIYTE